MTTSQDGSSGLQQHSDSETARRRRFLAAGGLSLTSLYLSWLGNQQHAEARPPKPNLQPVVYDLSPKPAHVPPRAQAMISLWMQGGPSHLDLFDPKPKLQEYDGKPFPGEVKYDNAAQASSTVLGCPWKFAPRGESGIELSELLPHLSEVVDDITLIRSMHTGVNNHGQSIRAMNSGRILGGRPSLGSWLTYALGCETRDLPAFVALIDPGQLPVLGVENWSNGWLPSTFQGTVVRPTEPRILDLQPAPEFQGRPQELTLGFLNQLNQRHLERRPGQLDLNARIATYDLAARMQTAAVEALDLAQETKATQAMYGMDEPETQEYGSRCLLARRLVERGVRFVQIYTANQLWDHHGRIRSLLPAACRKTDKPSAALLKDLKSRGLLDSTVVHWGGEMGRLPVIQNDAGKDKIGRDHNTYGFSMWVAGGGFRGGYIHGQTDDFGHKAIENVVNHFDYHATLMHLFGLRHEDVQFDRNGRAQTLTDNQPGQVIQELLA